MLKRILTAALLLSCAIARADSTTTGGARVVENPTSNGNLLLRVNVGGTKTDALTITGTTAGVALGPVVTNNYNGQRHTINGALVSGNVTSTDESGVLTLGSNYRLGAQAANAARTDATTTGAVLLLDNRTTNSAASFSFYANQTSDTTTTSADLIASATATGAWTFGPTVGPGLTHTLQAGGLVNLSLDAASGTSARQSFRDGSTTRWQWESQTGGTLVLFQAATTNVGQVTSGGAWTFGSSGAADIINTIQNNTNGTASTKQALIVKNNDTNTNSNGGGALLVAKGSATNTAGTNHLIDFTINGLATNSGYIGTNGANNAAFFATSDARMKKEIVTLSTSDALTKISAMRPVSYKWKADSSESIGFIAQEMATVLPKIVNQTDAGTGSEVPEGVQPWSMTESGVLPYLVAAMQQLKADHDALKADYDAYKAAHP